MATIMFDLQGCHSGDGSDDGELPIYPSDYAQEPPNRDHRP